MDFKLYITTTEYKNNNHTAQGWQRIDNNTIVVDVCRFRLHLVIKLLCRFFINYLLYIITTAHLSSSNLYLNILTNKNNKNIDKKIRQQITRKRIKEALLMINYRKGQ